MVIEGDGSATISHDIRCLLGLHDLTTMPSITDEHLEGDFFEVTINANAHFLESESEEFQAIPGIFSYRPECSLYSCWLNALIVLGKLKLNQVLVLSLNAHTVRLISK